MNILILSAGTRDKVVQYFKKELGDRGRIIATDCSNLHRLSMMQMRSIWCRGLRLRTIWM